MRGFATIVFWAALSSGAGAQIYSNPYRTPYGSPSPYKPPPSQIVDPNGGPRYYGAPQTQVNPQALTTFSQEPNGFAHKVGR